MGAIREGKMTGKITGHGGEERRHRWYELAKWMKLSYVRRVRDLSFLCPPVAEEVPDSERSWTSKRKLR